MSGSLLVTLVQAHNLATLAQNYTVSRGGSWFTVEHSTGNVGAALWWGNTEERESWSEVSVHVGRLRFKFTVILPSGSLLA